MSDTKDILNLIKTEAVETKAKINNLEAKVDNVEIKLDNLELKAGNLEKQQKQISLNNAQQFDRLKKAAGKEIKNLKETNKIQALEINTLLARSARHEHEIEETKRRLDS